MTIITVIITVKALLTHPHPHIYPHIHPHPHPPDTNTSYSPICKSDQSKIKSKACYSYPDSKSKQDTTHYSDSEYCVVPRLGAIRVNDSWCCNHRLPDLGRQLNRDSKASPAGYRAICISIQHLVLDSSTDRIYIRNGNTYQHK